LARELVVRIVSLLPAATEIVWALGLADDLVGVSHACDHPPAVVGRPVVTRPSAVGSAAWAEPGANEPAGLAVGQAPRTVEVLADRIAALRPDLVLAGPPLESAGAPGGAAARDQGLRAVLDPETTVVNLEPATIEGIFHAIATVGAMTDAEDEAVGLVEILRERLADVEEVVEERREQGHRPPRVVALEWLDPLVAPGLWVPEQVRRAGGWDLLGSDGRPATATTWEAIEDLDPEMLLLLPRAMSLRDAVAAWRAAPRPAAWDELQAARRGHVLAFDASAYFSRPGPRVVDGIELLAEIFDPAAFVDLAPAGSWVPVQ
jgi:iron complex transport system substrate-binding protein